MDMKAWLDPPRSSKQEDEAGVVVDTGYTKVFLVVDLSDACLPHVRDYDPVLELSEPVFPFEDTMSAALPRVADAVSSVLDWVGEFYWPGPFLQRSRGAACTSGPKTCTAAEEGLQCSPGGTAVIVSSSGGFDWRATEGIESHFLQEASGEERRCRQSWQTGARTTFWRFSNNFTSG